MIRVLVRPSKSWFGKRRQWKFQIQAGNGHRLDPRDTYANRGDIETMIRKLVASETPVELVMYDRADEVETRQVLR